MIAIRRVDQLTVPLWCRKFVGHNASFKIANNLDKKDGKNVEDENLCGIRKK